jgi:leucyl/phenylalanyl-tRNA--protein transferase
MFHRATDGSKVALVELCDRVLEGGFRLIDTQQETAHLAGLGQVLVPRSDYLRALRVLRDRPAQLPRGRRPVARLAARPLVAGQVEG